jgi:hypothetical protein
MEWIDVATIRPEIAEWVLGLCSKGGYWLCFRANGGWYINTNHGQIYVRNAESDKKIEIAYWVPIPKLPQDLFFKLFSDETTNSRRRS